MICLDTTFLIDLWRNAGDADHAVIRHVASHVGETFCVPAHSAGEFLEGGAAISPERYADSLRFLRRFHIGAVTLETAELYARIVADLRGRNRLQGVSKPDLWIAAWALQHGAVLVTRNPRHFRVVKGLSVESYG